MRDEVYIVCKGERGEGQIPHVARESFAAASRVVRGLLPGAAIKDKNAGWSWMATLNGVDEVWIYRLTVPS